MKDDQKYEVLNYHQLLEDKSKERQAHREIYDEYLSNVLYGVYDKDGDLIFKTKTRYEAKKNIKEFKEIDLEETGQEQQYYIRKLYTPTER